MDQQLRARRELQALRSSGDQHAEILTIWNAATGTERATLVGHRDWVGTCAISPDGRRIVSGSHDGDLKVWDADTASELLSLAGHTGEVGTCVFSPDGSLILSGSRDKGLRVWDSNSGLLRATLLLPGEIECVSLHPWLPRAACGGNGGALYKVDLVGIEYGPIIVTASEDEGGMVIRCPACWREHELERNLLGSVLICPTPECRLSLRVNPFVLKPAQWSPAEGPR
jgi:WD40 repeat protein